MAFSFNILSLKNSITATVVTLIPGVFLVAAACLHRAQWNDPQYTQSILIPFEFIFLLLTQLVFVIVFIVLIRRAFQRRWQLVVGHLLRLLACFLLMTLALAIDAPTLVYAT